MAIYNGTAGYFEIGPTGSEVVVSNMAHWSLTVSADANDVTTFGNIWRDFKSGCISWTASGDGFWDGATGQTGVHVDLVAGTRTKGIFYINTTKYYSGYGYLTGETIDEPVCGTVAISFDFQGDGTLTAAI